MSSMMSFTAGWEPRSSRWESSPSCPPRPREGSRPRLLRRCRRRRRRVSSPSLVVAVAALTLLLGSGSIGVGVGVVLVSAHGYLKTPRSRNLVAYQDTNWEMPLENDPQPEDCPHCLNRGGKLAQCGILYGTHEGEPWERNYDSPLSMWGVPMRPNLQGVYREGSIIDVEVLVTTHHKGHFVFSACPIDAREEGVAMEVPGEECFARNRLTFVSDELYGAPPDPNFPERAYIAPASKAAWSNGAPGVQPVVGALYKMKFRLPPKLSGDVVLLQWYYLTANSCKHEGYAEYDFPEEWGSDVALYPGLPDCGTVPPDGNGVPEQFWNCAEIKIVGDGDAAGRDPDPAEEGQEERIEPVEAAALVVPDEPVPVVPAPAPPARETEERVACADAASTYYEATEDCVGYYICMSGQQGEVYTCGSGQLYDAAKQMCNWKAEVSCGGGSVGGTGLDEEGNPVPTKEPTPSPTGKPNQLLDWDPDAVDRGHDKTIIGYYASWQWYDRDGLAAPVSMDFSKITRANFAFFQITEGGDIFGTDNWADPITLFGFYDWMSEAGTVPQYCSWDDPGELPACSAHNYREGLIYLAHAAGAEVYPSLGGWSLSDPFPVMAANAGARANFAARCVDLIKSYNFDGIDLDWEYPGYEPHSGTPEDTVNFNLLLDDVRAALDELGAETGRFYGLTAALPCGPSIIANQDIAHVSSVLTELNLMTYDFHGSWNDKSGVNAPLYDQEDSPEFSVHGCVANWLEGGATKEKINIGFPFYGRSFLGAQRLYEPHQGNDDSTWHQDEGVPQYYNILKKGNELTSIRDDKTMTQYAYSSKGMVSYDDERAICDKTEYAQVHGLNGYIIWELSGDMNDDLSTPLLDAANAKLRDPNLDCANLDLSDIVAMSEAKPNGDDNAVTDIVFYPSFDSQKCLHDGLQSDWLRPSDLFNNAQSCCTYHFSWNEDCLQESEPEDVINAMAQSASALYYPSAVGHVCLSDVNQPEWLTDSLYDNVEDCCAGHYGWTQTDCIQNSNSIALGDQTLEAFIVPVPDVPGIVASDAITASDVVPAFPAPSPTVLATAANIIDEPTMMATAANIVDETDTFSDETGKFFPIFNYGATTTCQNVGTAPAWMSGNYLKETKSECCHSFAFQWDYDECLMGVASDANAFASYTWTTEKHFYYPNYEKGDISCEYDSDHPSWMAGDYLTENLWQCCRNSFNDEELVQKCFDMPSCADCPSTMNSYYEAEALSFPAAATSDTAVIETTLTAVTSIEDSMTPNGAAAVEIETTPTAVASPEASQVQVTPYPTPSPTKRAKLAKPNEAVAATISSNAAATISSASSAVESVLEAHKNGIDSKILLFESPSMEWLESSVYRYNDMLAALRVMYQDGVAGKFFFMGDSSENGYLYGLVNIAAFLAQSMKETIKYNACDENSWDLVSGGYPLSNACGQLGQSYQDYTCSDHEKHMECPVEKDMTITATTNAKWWGAPAPLFCGPKELYPFTGYWDHSVDCNNPWADPPLSCDVYDGQKGGNFANESPSPNSSGRTDVEGCCWWGRGVIQTTGVCNFGKLNFYLGARAAEEGRESRYPDIDFCSNPGAICASDEHKELKWIAGMFYWVESLQTYSAGGWDYISELKSFVDNGMTGNNFIDAVSGIVNRGCHNPPCASGAVDGGAERASNFRKVLTELDLLS